MFPTPPFPLAGLLPALASVPNYHSNPITQRVRRKRQRLPPSLLIENASDVFLAFQNIACPRRFRSRLATIRELSRGGTSRRVHGRGPNSPPPSCHQSGNTHNSYNGAEIDDPCRQFFRHHHSLLRNHTFFSYTEFNTPRYT